MLVISTSDYLWFVDQALDGMVAIVRELGDDLASTRPELPDANAPYAILTHCLGVMEYWGGALVAGRTVTRDRDAEFRAQGRVDDLVRQTVDARRQLSADVARVDPSAPPRQAPLLPEYAETPIGQTQAGALLHLYEELAQHFGQLQLSRDVLVARPRS